MSLAVALTAISAGLGAASQPSAGVLEAIDSAGIAVGWAFDPDSQSSSIDVHLYVDGPAGAGGAFVGSISASIPRADIAAPGPHGFRFAIPTSYRDGKPHALYVYAIDTGGPAGNLLLSAAPRAFTLNPTAVFLTNGVIRVGLEPRCGGTLVELSLQARNPISNFDCTGRQIQTALYDGSGAYDACAGCTGVWGWNPVQGGDRYNFGSPLTAFAADAMTAFLSTRPHEWHPDDKGGGPGRPVPSDVVVEQWVSFVPGQPQAVRVRYRITHLGSDSHANVVQEFPAVYAAPGYDRFVYYAGTAPWTNDAVTWGTLPLPGEPAPQRYVGERWASMVDAAGFGLTVYVPHQYPYANGLRWHDSTPGAGDGGSYFRPHVPFSIAGPSTFDGEIYVLVGDYRDARRSIYGIVSTSPPVDRLPPFGWIDQPGASQLLSGVAQVGGWVFDDTAVGVVDVLVDGVVAGRASYGSLRPDVQAVFPRVPVSIGFSMPLDTRSYTNGAHRIGARTRDSAGRESILPEVPVVFSNTAADTTRPVVTITRASVFKQTLEVSVAATDNVGVVRVELWIDGRLAKIDSDVPYTFRVNLKTYGAGSHQVVARAFDAAGNVGVSGSYVTPQ